MISYQSKPTSLWKLYTDIDLVNILFIIEIDPRPRRSCRTPGLWGHLVARAEPGSRETSATSVDHGASGGCHGAKAFGGEGRSHDKNEVKPAPQIQTHTPLSDFCCQIRLFFFLILHSFLKVGTLGVMEKRI